MALTGILFGAVVIMWGVFLVPWALRRYDEATSARPIETFSDAMRVLRRRGEQAPAPEARTGAATSGASVRTPPRAAARAAAARRRRVLFMLLGVTVVVGVLAALSLLPWWAPAVPVLVVIGWLVICRVQVRREEQAAWARRRIAGDPADDEDTVRIATGRFTGGAVARTVVPPRARAESPSPAAAAQQVDAPHAPHAPRAPLADASAPHAPLADASAPHAREEDAAPVTAADLAEETSVAVPVIAEDGSSLWDPLPVTLPTYVSKPRAPRSIRTIDLGAPGAWTSGHVTGEQTEMPAAEAATEHARAVGD